MIEDQGMPPQEEEEGDLGDEGREEFADWIERIYDIRTIRNPYNEQSIMIIATVGHRAIMGGIVEMDDGLTPIYQPLMFTEIPVKINEATGKVLEIGPQFSKHFMLLHVIDWMIFRIDSIYICRSNRACDMALVEEYEKAV